MALLLAASSAALCQTGGGATLVGTVTDSSGAVANAKVAVINTATNFLTETVTRADGNSCAKD